MRQRMVTVVCGITVLIVILLLYKTPVFNIGIALVSVIAAHEILYAVGINKKKALSAICYAFAALIPFAGYLNFDGICVLLFFAGLLAAFSIMLKEHEDIRVEKMALCFLITVLVTVSMSGLIYMRDDIKINATKDLSLFYISLAFLCAWITDGGGYIFGRLLGKNKLSPKISPKKTVEGAVGGIISAVVFSVLLLWVYSLYLSKVGIFANFNYISLIILSLLCAVVSIIGDLSASIIKRQNDIKDFGNILPGHGGILDRFDSMLFVVPLIIFWVRVFPVVFK